MNGCHTRGYSRDSARQPVIAGDLRQINQAAGSGLECEKEPGETEQEERHSSEIEAIFKSISDFFIGPSRSHVKGISCLSSRALQGENFGCIRLWKD
jgi:hypothetical protein